jgi:hypothetical protein
MYDGSDSTANEKGMKLWLKAKKRQANKAAFLLW